ncbi:DJ-1/PfpI family protein [Lojkania enalia]|uniref:DJ-1/PfpI family protein n=1 Tax=Lojkania enalia TaxID=147567 RepID=A0A9P4K766_9PLEO|nr:DJ-1/PfpI family protein [Didymosphaeria enalia]
MHIPKAITLLSLLFFPVLSIPTQPQITNTTRLPTNYAMLVFPGYQALDVFGPLDVLNSLAMVYQLPMHLQVISGTLEPVSTIPKTTPTMNMSHGDFGEKIVPTTTFADHADEGNIDVLIVPGGGGTREPLEEEIAFVKAMYPKVQYIVSVCTGATILARSGILDGRNATSNKKAWAWVSSTGPNVHWIPTARWVRDGNIWTSSGVAAGIDAALALVADIYGEDVADYIAMFIEYRRQKDETDDPFAAIWGAEQKKME